MNLTALTEFQSDDANAQRLALRVLRRTFGLTQKGLGQLAGIDHTTISRFERGDTEMSPAVRKQLISVFEAQRRMQERIDQADDARKRNPDFDEKAGAAATALGFSDEIPPSDPNQLSEWRKKMYPIFRKRVDVDFTEMDSGGTVGEYTKFLRELASDLSRRKSELEKELDDLRHQLLEANKELLEAYRRIMELERDQNDEKR